MPKKFNLLLISIGISTSLFAQNNDWQKLAKMGKEFYENGEFESAYQAFSKARELAPNNSNIDNYVAQSAYRAGKFKEALEAYQRANENKSDTWSNYNKGNAQFKNQDLSDAIESYKEALRKDPTNELARQNLAKALKKQENQKDKNDKNQDEKNKDKKNNQDKDKNKGDNEDDKNQNKDNKDKQENKDNQNDKNQQEQPKMGKEQTDQLLESMMNADKKAQDKLKEKEKGVGTAKREKDW